MEIQDLTHVGLSTWINEVAELTHPKNIYICDGTDAEWTRITGELVSAGTLVRLKKKPNSFWCASDPTDLARVEDRTFICSVNESDAGPTNNWMAPEDMKNIMRDLYKGSMQGRTMYVIPFWGKYLAIYKPHRCFRTQQRSRPRNSPALSTAPSYLGALVDRCLEKLPSKIKVRDVKDGD